MTLAAGTRLGPYEILSPLGAGGMGAVYRARDTRLGREVAIKVLPAEVSSDPGRLKRFEKEARSASALNHPNIVTIYEIGSADSVAYIAMELVAGKTLRELLFTGPLATKKLLQIATQIADGLTRAHEAGIVHRDLKPENLMVTKDGRVKILDFGLAKLTHLGTDSDTGTNLPTETGTSPGMVLGTVGYMSPEQASGQPVDFRSDQFSLGSILYEMATGKRAFHRGTAAQTLTAIIQDEPEPIERVNAQAPAPLRWIVERCHSKDPEERYASTKDLARELAVVRDHLSEAAVSGAETAVAGSRGLRRIPLPATIVAALALVAAGFIAGSRIGRPEAARARVAEPPSFHQLTFRHGYIFSARFAPDGHTIVFGGVWDGNPVRLFTARSEGVESTPLPLPSADVLSISRSGELAVSLGRRHSFAFSSRGSLARVPLAGGAPREILEDVQEADWTPDGGALVVGRRVGDRYRLESPIGKVVYETKGWVSHPRVSPDGGRIAFFDHPNFADDRGAVAVIDPAGGKKILSESWASEQGLAWAPSGNEVWFTASELGVDRSLYAVTLSGRRRLVLRVPGSIRLHDIFRDGRILLSRDTLRSGIVCLAPGEKTERDLSWHDFSVASDLSSDGKTLLISEQGGGAGPGYAVYTRGTDGSPAVRLGEGLALALSPDNKWALAQLMKSPPQLVLWPTGAGEPRLLKRGPLESFGYSAEWLPDGRRIVFPGREPGHGLRLYVQPLEGEPRAITPEGIPSDPGQGLSSDGRFVAAIGPEGKGWLYPIEGGDPRPLPGLAPDERPIGWSADGRSLFALRRQSRPVAVYRLEIATGRKTLWKQLAPADPAGLLGFSAVQFADDGAAYAYTYWRLLSDLYLAEGLR